MRLLALPSITLAAGLVCLLRPEPAWAYAFFFLFGMSHGSSGAIGTAAWAEMFGADRIGTIRGVSSSVSVFLTAIAPAVFGLALDLGVSVEGIVVGCALLVIGISWPLSIAVRWGQERRTEERPGQM